MNNHTLDHSVEELNPEIPRRTFLGGSVLGGLGFALGLGIQAEGSPIANDLTAEECQQVTASDMLAMFSTLAWKVPVKLQRAEDAKAGEQLLFNDFDKHYRKLSELAKQLKLSCANLTQDDRRKSAAAELAELTDRNVRAPQPGSTDGDAVYLNISVLVAENRQVSRAANEILPETAPDDHDNKLICEMLAEIRAMEKIKADLDVARTVFTAAFKDFTGSLKALHENIIGASDDAAKAERGEGSKESAVKKIEEAEKILDAIITQSVPGTKSMVTPQGLKVLLAVPKAVLKGELPTTAPITQRRNPNDIQFRTAAYSAASDREAARAGQIYNILAECIVPSNRFSIYALTGACALVLKSYAQDPPREEAVLNALQSWPFASTGSNFRSAASRIARLG